MITRHHFGMSGATGQGWNINHHMKEKERDEKKNLIFF
jgi:hypothetical protein